MISLCGLVTSANVIDFKIHEDYISPRIMGMGGAFAAVADDHSALFYNPAGLARMQNGRFNLFLLNGTLGGDDIFGLANKIETASQQPTPEAAISQTLSTLYGTNYYQRFSALGGFWTRPNWGVAFIPLDISLDAYIRKQMSPEISVIARETSTFVYGWGKDFSWFGPHHFSLGVSAKALYRLHFAESLQGVDLASNTNLIRPSDMAEGLAADIDVGTLFTPSLPPEGFLSWFRYAKPTFALVIRNLLDYGYLTNLHLVGPESSKPPQLERRIDIGTAWQYPDLWIFKTKGVMDFRNIGHSNYTFLKGFHLGAELEWEVGSWLKGSWALGLNQGYLTAGFGGHFAWFHLDLSTWGEEVGTSNARQENRNFTLKMSLDF